MSMFMPVCPATAVDPLQRCSSTASSRGRTIEYGRHGAAYPSAPAVPWDRARHLRTGAKYSPRLLCGRPNRRGGASADQHTASDATPTGLEVSSIPLQRAVLKALGHGGAKSRLSELVRALHRFAGRFHHGERLKGRFATLFKTFVSNSLIRGRNCISVKRFSCASLPPGAHMTRS